MNSLRNDIDKINNGEYNNSSQTIEQNVGLKLRDNYGYSSDYMTSTPTIIPRKKKPTKRVVSNQKITFENIRKVRDIILKVVIAGTLAGSVYLIAKFTEKTDEVEFENTPTMQEYTQEDANSMAAELASNEILSGDEVKFVQDVNNGQYQEPLITDQFSTENINAPQVEEYNEVPKEEIKHVRTFGVQDGYTPLSQDPTYKDPSLMSR